MTLNLTRRGVIAGGLSVAVGTTMPGMVSAQDDWPRRPITVAMTSPAGGATDRGYAP